MIKHAVSNIDCEVRINHVGFFFTGIHYIQDLDMFVSMCIAVKRKIVFM